MSNSTNRALFFRWPFVFVAFFLFVFPGNLQATILYNQDFEAAPVGQVANPTALGLYSGTVNMGGPALQWEFTANGGVADSKGLSVSFDGTNRPGYFIGFGTPPPFGGDTPPVNNGTTEPSKIRFSVDAKLVGSMTSTPLQFRIYQQDPNYEARRGIDANMDGDMVDGATHFQSIVRPTVIESSEYSHISFTLDQGDISASITRQPTPPGPPVNLPLNPEFDPLRMIHWSISFGFEGFGFDAGNNVSVDNIRIESVPEPASFGIAVVAACSFVLLRRSRIAILA